MSATDHRLDRRKSRRNRDSRQGIGLVALSAVLAVLLAPVHESAAFELIAAKTGREGPAYFLRIEATFRATPEQLLAVLTDYERIHELHPDLLESRSLGMVDSATEEVYTSLEGCVLLLCRTLHRVEQIRMEGNTLHARDVPGRGSFSEGTTEWHFMAEEGGARLQYQARFIPAFRVTPVFGAMVLARAVERVTLETMAEVDRRAARRHD